MERTVKSLRQVPRPRGRPPKKKKVVKPRKPRVPHITISKEVAKMFEREHQSYREGNIINEHGYPQVYLLGENKKHVVTDFEKLINCLDGCREMPSISSTEIANAYIRLAKRKLTPCAIARVGNDFANDSVWAEDSGAALWNKNMQFILSYNGYVFRAAALKNKNEDLDYDPERDYDDNDNYDEYANLQELEVRIGK